jgi:hypothetical protein
MKHIEAWDSKRDFLANLMLKKKKGKYFKQLTNVVVASTGLLAASVGIQTEFASSRGAGIARGMRRTISISRLSAEIQNQSHGRRIRHSGHIDVQVLAIA